MILTAGVYDKQGADGPKCPCTNITPVRRARGNFEWPNRERTAKGIRGRGSEHEGAWLLNVLLENTAFILLQHEYHEGAQPCRRYSGRPWRRPPAVLA